jgi:UPF0716 protein FxsA
MFGRLLILFITIPMIELILFLTVGDWIGLPATIGVVILTGFLGAWLTMKEGLRTLQRYRSAMAEGRLPHQEVMEGMVILLAGVVLLTPGFLTDAAGFLLLIPPVRAGVVRWLKESLKNRVRLVVPGMGAMGTPDKAARPEPPGKVIDV